MPSYVTFFVNTMTNHLHLNIMHCKLTGSDQSLVKLKVKFRIEEVHRQRVEYTRWWRCFFLSQNTYISWLKIESTVKWLSKHVLVLLIKVILSADSKMTSHRHMYLQTKVITKTTPCTIFLLQDWILDVRHQNCLCLHTCPVQFLPYIPFPSSNVLQLKTL